MNFKQPSFLIQYIQGQQNRTHDLGMAQYGSIENITSGFVILIVCFLFQMARSLVCMWGQKTGMRAALAQIRKTLAQSFSGLITRLTAGKLHHSLFTRLLKSLIEVMVKTSHITFENEQLVIIYYFII